MKPEIKIESERLSAEEYIDFLKRTDLVSQFLCLVSLLLYFNLSIYDKECLREEK